jgi:hypothetical protein
VGLKITKLSALERQLEAAVFLILQGFPPEPIHTLIGACRGLLGGLSKAGVGDLWAKWHDDLYSRVRPEYLKEFKSYENRVANFLKHADRDPCGVIDDIDLSTVNEIELFICIVAFQDIRKELSVRLAIGIFYCGLRGEKWFDLAGFLRDKGGESDLDYFRASTNAHVRKILLEAFENSIERGASIERPARIRISPQA